MRGSLAGILSIVFMVAMAAMAIWIIAGNQESLSSYRSERCKKFRIEFFDACLAAEPRYRCEVQWAQLNGKVFDSPPDAPWADQLDCSKELK